jgi:hypothetical protein
MCPNPHAIWVKKKKKEKKGCLENTKNQMKLVGLFKCRPTNFYFC